MKKFVRFSMLAFSVGAFGTGGTLAADLAVKAPRMAAPVYDWAGWYGGVNAGYGGSTQTATETAISGAGFPALGAGTLLYGGPNSYRMSTSGWFGGAQGGYNWQLSPHVVMGIEADLQGGDIQGGNGCVNPCATLLNTVPGNNFFGRFPVVFQTDAFEQKIDWFGTVRGRVGYAAGPAFLYATGGLAYGDVNDSGAVIGRTFTNGGRVLNSFSGSYNRSTTKVGWTAGAGAEAKIARNWSVKLEYLYVDLGNSTDTFNTIYAAGGNAAAGSVAASRYDSSHAREHLVRLGLNYFFNSPVVAKY